MAWNVSIGDTSLPVDLWTRAKYVREESLLTRPMASKNPCIRVASPAGDWTRNSAHKTGFKRPRTGPERIPSRISLDLSLLGQARPARTPSGDSLQVSPGLSCRDSDKFLPAILWHRDPTLTPTRHPACLRVQHHLVRGSEGDVWITASPGESAVDILAHTPHQRHKHMIT